MLSKHYNEYNPLYLIGIRRCLSTGHQMIEIRTLMNNRGSYFSFLPGSTSVWFPNCKTGQLKKRSAVITLPGVFLCPYQKAVLRIARKFVITEL